MNSEWMILSYSQNGTLPDLPRDHLIDGLFEAVRKNQERVLRFLQPARMDTRMTKLGNFSDQFMAAVAVYTGI